jgi:1-acyl-sn-glycerol-3-phosphate acyltransferase
VIPYNPEKTTLTSAVRAVRHVFEAGGVLGIYAEGTVGFRETEMLPFEDGAVAFAAASGVPILPCVIVGSTFMWFRKRVVFRYGDPIPTTAAKGRDGRAALEAQVRAAMEALLPDREPRLPRRRPLRFLGDLLTGPADLERRRAELGE